MQSISPGRLLQVAWLSFSMSLMAMSGSAGDARATIAENAEVFSVVSIKPSTPGGDLSYGVNGSSYSAKSAPVFWIMMDAWFPRSTSYWRIKGEPEWVNREEFDIEARTDEALLPELHRLSTQQREARIKGMVRRLLAERFHLACHLEERPSRIYQLVGGRNLKLKEHSGGADSAEMGVPLGDGGFMLPETKGGEHILHFTNVTLRGLAEVLSGMGDFVDDPVEDHTGLTGHYDFDLRKRIDEEVSGGENPSGAAMPRRASNWEVESLGLKLVATRGMVPVLVVDHIEHPSSN